MLAEQFLNSLEPQQVLNIMKYVVHNPLSPLNVSHTYARKLRFLKTCDVTQLEEFLVKSEAFCEAYDWILGDEKVTGETKQRFTKTARVVSFAVEKNMEPSVVVCVSRRLHEVGNVVVSSLNADSGNYVPVAPESIVNGLRMLANALEEQNNSRKEPNL